MADSTGAVLAINTYDEFGIPASTNVGRFQFTGQAWLPEAGLFYYKARMYSPTLGRFLQTDPIGYADGLNWYNYVGGDPINSVDPLGLSPEFCYRSGGYSYTTYDSQGVPTTTVVAGDLQCLTIPDFGPVLIQPTTGINDFTEDCLEALREADKDRAAVERARRSRAVLARAAARAGIDARLLAAIGVRESGFRNVRESGGGAGTGVFQLTNRPGVTSREAMDINFSAGYAAQLLANNMNFLRQKFPNFTQMQLTQATAASYNFGTDDISGNPNTIDVGTSGDNYGRIVLNLISCF